MVGTKPPYTKGGGGENTVPRGNGGMIARLDGDTWRSLPYPDPLPMFLGGGASLPGQQALVIGGPGGLLRTVGTAQSNK